MNPKNYFTITGVIFSAIAVLHLLRLVYGWGAVISGWTVPIWLSWAALVVAGYLAYQGFRLNSK